jgi:hypothetical protein
MLYAPGTSSDVSRPRAPDKGPVVVDGAALGAVESRLLTVMTILAALK